MYHHRKNSVKDKVIGKKWICSDSERNTLYRQCGPSRRVSVPTKSGVVSSYRLGNFIANGWENYSNFGKEWRFPGFGPPPTPWPSDSALGLSCASGCSFHLPIEIKASSCLTSWSHLILVGLCCVHELCHSFKSGALPLSLLLLGAPWPPFLDLGLGAPWPLSQLYSWVPPGPLSLLLLGAPWPLFLVLGLGAPWSPFLVLGLGAPGLLSLKVVSILAEVS